MSQGHRMMVTMDWLAAGRPVMRMGAICPRHPQVCSLKLDG
jgi:hypothetical protein